MTTKEFEYIKKNWDKCISGFWSYGLEPFELKIFNVIKPQGDYFVAIPAAEWYAFSKSASCENETEFLRCITEGSVTKVKIHHKKVQRITGYSKGRYLANWKNNDWKAEVRSDKMKQLGI